MEACLRHWCSSRYLQISPLHLEFRLPLAHSSPVVLNAVPWLGHGISHQACRTAYMPFTPNNSEQRSHLTCYRGCWHVISRCLFAAYSHHAGIPSRTYSSATKEVYNLSAFIIHAASLRQAFAHCGRIPVIALEVRYTANQLMGRRPFPRRGRSRFPHTPLTGVVASGII